GGDHQLDNLPISLYRAGESEPVQQVQTDAQGNYEITGLYPGSYELAITLPEGVRFARLIDSQMTRFSLITSDGNGAKGNQGRSAAFPLAMAENRQAQDIGMGTLGRLGDYAWLDLDKDGMQDAGEPGVPGIIIKLYQYGQVVAETTTDEYGRYLFSDVYPGPHELEVTMWGELKTTRQQDEFVLVASILPEGKTGTALAQGILVPSGGRNLNCDLGFVLITEGQLPTAMLQPPRKDWTPLVPTVPKRTRD
ncbi:MAG: hypothetical protein GX650_06335, partial [Clostridiales bacterium]|nr:hypothetical protein [Clostridiales bacterium]